MYGRGVRTINRTKKFRGERGSNPHIQIMSLTSYQLLNLPKKSKKVSVLMNRMQRIVQVNAEKNRKNVSLKKRNQQFQCKYRKNKQNACRKDESASNKSNIQSYSTNEKKGMTCHHVSKKSKSQRKRSQQVSGNFNHKNQRNQKNGNSAWDKKPKKGKLMLVKSNHDQPKVQSQRKKKWQKNLSCACETKRNQSQEITTKNKSENCCNKRNISKTRKSSLGSNHSNDKQVKIFNDILGVCRYYVRTRQIKQKQQTKKNKGKSQSNRKTRNTKIITENLQRVKQMIFKLFKGAKHFYKLRNKYKKSTTY